MRTLVVVVIIVLLLIYFRPILEWSWIPKIVINGSGERQIAVYRTTKSRLVSNKKYRNCHEKWIQLNPRIKMYWFDDKDCQRFMSTQGKRVFDAYMALQPGAYKADLFRLCILYQQGGVYVDAEAIPYVSIREMMKDTESNFISVLDSGSEGIHNGLIISSPRHPFLKAGIERILEIVEARSYEDGTLSITGPVCLARAINKCMGRDLDAKFKAGINKYAGQDLYLFVHQFGPSQYVYKGKKRILAKKHCLWSYLKNLKKKSNYISMYRNKKVYKTII